MFLLRNLKEIAIQHIGVYKHLRNFQFKTIHPILNNNILWVYTAQVMRYINLKENLKTFHIHYKSCCVTFLSNTTNIETIIKFLSHTDQRAIVMDFRNLTDYRIEID